MEQQTPSRFIDLRAAVLLVVANMIGTGVFTTLGFQAQSIPNASALLALWILGAVVALCGALSYAELIGALPRSGGEYHLLGRIYHRALGNIAALVSVTVGFSAPVALAAVALGRYASVVLKLDSTWIALGAVLAVTAMHAYSRELGRTFQVSITQFKVAVIVVFCALSLSMPRFAGTLPFEIDRQFLDDVFSAPFGFALVYVLYAYAGWNAAAYVAGEVKNPSRNVPLALSIGTLLVAALYLSLNWVFLRSVPLQELAGTIEVGAVSSRNLFGDATGAFFSLVLSLLLLSTVSAMTLAGPRVIQTVGEDVPGLHWIGARTGKGAPTAAILGQLLLVVAFILTDSFEAILAIAGFTVTLMSWLVVAGVILLRWRAPELPRPFRVPLYPVTPLIFLSMTGFCLVAVSLQRPFMVAAVVSVLAAIGALFYASMGQAATGEPAACPGPSGPGSRTGSDAPPPGP